MGEGYEFVDKRGLNKVEAPAVLAAVPEVPEKKVRGEKLEWKSLGFTIVFLMVNNQQMLAGRAVGLRDDEKVFTADYALPPVCDEEFRWQGEARKRLETFLACSCDRGSRCKFHAEKCGGQNGPGEWLIEDVKRLEKVQSTPLPECLEILMKAEMARSQSRVETPGR